ncbi:hypothetical protein CAP35_08725 [Chitinophagaceae bacterium IBVUCB1]|nr:hypothetical protein CAP35_08725 [Chitinophagaceae bacterium IBVUCB1]
MFFIFNLLMDYLKIPKQGIEGKLNAGTMLIAAPFLNDVHFSRSVICLCEHGDDGTVGFVINRQADISLNDLMEYNAATNLNIYAGGPVQTDTLHMLHRLPDVLGGNKIADNIYWGGSFEVLKLLIESGDVAENDIRLFLGYAGWSVGQLDAELQEGSWLIGTCNSRLLFDTGDDKIWHDAVLSLGDEYKHLLHMPLNPQDN